MDLQIKSDPIRMEVDTKYICSKQIVAFSEYIQEYQAGAPKTDIPKTD